MVRVPGTDFNVIGRQRVQPGRGPVVAVRKRDGQPARCAQRRYQRRSTKRALMSRRQSHFSITRGKKRVQKDIAHASHYWPSRKEKEQTQKNLSKEAVGALSGIQPPGLSSKSSSRKNLYPLKTNRPKGKEKTPNNDALCSTPEPKPQIFSHTAHEKAQISNISRQR